MIFTAKNRRLTKKNYRLRHFLFFGREVRNNFARETKKRIRLRKQVLRKIRGKQENKDTKIELVA